MKKDMRLIAIANITEDIIVDGKVVARGYRMKECSKCKESQSLLCFNLSKTSPTGFRPECKRCAMELRTRPEAIIRGRQNMAKLRTNSPEVAKARLVKWRQENKEWVRLQEVDRIKKYSTSDKGRETTCKRAKINRQRNPHIIRLRSMLQAFLKYKRTVRPAKHTEELLGYTYEEFKEKFPCIDNMNIDHKIPVSWFRIDVPINIANSLSNLQLLTQFDNYSKGNYWSHPVDREFYDEAILWIKDEYKDKLHYEQSNIPEDN